MPTETTSLDTKSPYEIATAARPDPRGDFDVLSDVVDQSAPELLDLYRRLGLFEAPDSATFSLSTVMDFLKDAVATGADLESKHPGFIQKVREQDFPQELERVQSSREKAK